VRHRRRFTLFTIVGLTGVAVNVVAMWGLHALGVQYLLATVLATQTAIGWNLFLSERFVFHDKKQHTEFNSRLTQYYVVNNVDLLLRIPLMVVLVEMVGMRPSPANLILIAAASCMKYVIINKLVYRPHPADPRPTKIRRFSRERETA
jgi:dolichol-phosphate mannosyltransferase